MRHILARLHGVGYGVTLDGDNLRLHWTGQGQPDAATVNPLLTELRSRKAEVIQYLRQSSDSTIILYSELLKEKIYIVPKLDARLLSLPDGTIVFSLQDLEGLNGRNFTGLSAGQAGEQLKDLAQMHKELLPDVQAVVRARLAAAPTALAGNPLSPRSAEMLAAALKVFPDAKVVPDQPRTFEGGGRKGAQERPYL
jgi:hypothetical protein